ncbi:Ferric iron ABC transporter, iron-binding protein [Pseudoalteromonas luteoviolacea B = ATCC 29581]|nr:Ferric iron ABC transporter, iron-binding protein [Pseudoalteromonas luteoviolacea B = ATCC 29581]
MKKVLLAVGLLIGSTQVSAKEEVNIYSYRQPFLIQPILEEFTAQTGIKTNVVFAKSGLIERVQREGKHARADLVLTSNFGDLIQLESLALTQPIESDIVAKNVPAVFRDPEGDWIALTKRARVIYADKQSGIDTNTFSYEDLAKPEFKGQICTRSGKHPYNISLVASMIAHHGEAYTKTWLEGVKANLARKPQGNDRGQVQAIKEGLCKLSLGNSYYYGQMLKNEKQRVWAEAVNIVFPNQADRGAHINVSGVVLTRYAKNKASAVKLIEFLTEDKAQSQYASLNMEYPVKPGVDLSELVKSWGEFKEDGIALSVVSENRAKALKLLDEVKFDL